MQGWRSCNYNWRKLEAKYVIHTVGPVWNGGKNREEQLLSNCYRNSLNIAVEHSLKTIGFPSISTGIYRFPKEIAAKVAVSEVLDFLQTDNTIEEVIFVCFDDATYDIYLKLLEDNY
jgi:O-acetyl-ADP-ribose deacetylase